MFMRNYNKIIRFYDSWFADLCDQEKAFTAEECWAVILAIRECQRQETTDPLDELPTTIKRGLQMATLREQVERMLERSERMRLRGQSGGLTAKANQEAAARKVAEETKAEQQRKDQERQRKEFQALPEAMRTRLISEKICSPEGDTLPGKGLAYYNALKDAGIA